MQRAITALVGGVLVLAASIYSDWTYFLIFAAILGFSQMEFYKLSGLDGMLPLKSFGTILGLLIFTLTFLVEKEQFQLGFDFDPQTLWSSFSSFTRLTFLK